MCPVVQDHGRDPSYQLVVINNSLLPAVPVAGSLFMVLVGGMGTIEGPVIGALVLFGLQEALSSYGAWYLVIVGGLAAATTLVASRGLWGLVSERFGWSLLPVGYRVLPKRKA